MSARLPAAHTAFTLVASTLAACAVDDPESVDLAKSKERDVCPTSECGENSPVIDGVPFYELSRTGIPNPQGFRIAAFLDEYGQPVELDVIGTELVGRDKRGNVVVSGSDLQSATLLVDGPKGARYEIHVVEISTMDYWAQPLGPTPDDVTTYYLAVTGTVLGDIPVPLCSTPPAGGWPGGDVLNAIAFKHDRYDVENKEVITGAAAEDWLTIACAGSAPAKMHLTRHTESGALDGYATTQQQRQAMFKMFTANACGRHSFTVAGEPLRYRDAQGLMTTTWTDVDTMETVWSADGAVCLDVHRLDVPTQASPEQAAAILDDLLVECGGARPPTCESLGITPDTWQDLGYYVQSMNPIGS
jgi:hypothetical protein